MCGGATYISGELMEFCNANVKQLRAMLHEQRCIAQLCSDWWLRMALCKEGFLEENIEYHPVMRIPFEDLPLHINDAEPACTIAIWRLRANVLCQPSTTATSFRLSATAERN